jgi:hypothetical protein
MDLLIGMVLVASGLLSVFSGVSGWEWFLAHRKTAPMVALLGRAGARVFYVLLGLAVIALGAWFLAWFVWESRQGAALAG